MISGTGPRDGFLDLVAATRDAGLRKVLAISALPAIVRRGVDASRPFARFISLVLTHCVSSVAFVAPRSWAPASL